MPQVPMQFYARAMRYGALAIIGAAALSLGGCKFELASMGCDRVRPNELHVSEGQICKFRYDQGDVARYVVKVTRPPIHGEAKGQGRYLTYMAKPGFTGEDRLTIRIERRSLGHVQWQVQTVTVKVDSGAGRTRSAAM